MGRRSCLHGDYYGPTVNLAARLVAVAPTAAVVVSDGVKDAAGDGFRFEPFATGVLRGFPDVTEAFRMVASSSLPSSR